MEKKGAPLIFKSIGDKKVANLIKSGGIGVIPTDTVYGLACSALKKAALKKIYRLKKRSQNKPPVILISSDKDLSLFGIKITKLVKKITKRFWPGRVSIIIPIPQKRFAYLHRGKKSLAFRLPQNKKLIQLIKKTGSLATSSANISKKEVADSIRRAILYFGKGVDFYVDVGRKGVVPSTIISFSKSGEVNVLRGKLKK